MEDEPNFEEFLFVFSNVLNVFLTISWPSMTSNNCRLPFWERGSYFVARPLAVGSGPLGSGGMIFFAPLFPHEVMKNHPMDSVVEAHQHWEP